MALARGALGPPGQAYLACLKQAGLVPAQPDSATDSNPSTDPTFVALWRGARAAWAGGLRWDALRGDLSTGPGTEPSFAAHWHGARAAWAGGAYWGALRGAAAAGAVRAAGEGACLGAAAHSVLNEARAHVVPATVSVVQARLGLTLGNCCLACSSWHSAWTLTNAVVLIFLLTLPCLARISRIMSDVYFSGITTLPMYGCLTFWARLGLWFHHKHQYVHLPACSL